MLSFKTLIAVLAVIETAASAAATYTADQIAKARVDMQATSDRLEKTQTSSWNERKERRDAAKDAVEKLEREKRDAIFQNKLGGLGAADLILAVNYFSSVYARMNFFMSNMADGVSKTIIAEEVADKKARAKASIQEANAQAIHIAEAAVTEAEKADRLAFTGDAYPETAGTVKEAVLKQSQQVISIEGSIRGEIARANELFGKARKHIEEAERHTKEWQAETKKTLEAAASGNPVEIGRQIGILSLLLDRTDPAWETLH